MGSEQRQFTRSRCRFPVQVRVQGNRHEGILCNISDGGMFIEMPDLPEKNAEIEVLIPAWEDLPGIVVAGKAVHIRPGRHTKNTILLPGIGVQNDSTSSQFQSLVDRVNNADEPPSVEIPDASKEAPLEDPSPEATQELAADDGLGFDEDDLLEDDELELELDDEIELETDDEFVAEPAAPSAAPADPTDPGATTMTTNFKVSLKKGDKVTSMMVQSESAQAAGEKALMISGAGWEIDTVETS